jgi:lipopolysaccharide transport system permease protein
MWTRSGQARALQASSSDAGGVSAPAPLPVTIIRPSSGWRALELGSLWRHRELVGFLTWRNIAVRYKQTALGAGWALLQPFLTMVVFTIFFGHLAGLSSRTGGVPYPLVTYAGVLPWQLFQYAISQGGLSLVANQNLVTKVYFPRLAIPLAVVFAALVDFAIASVVLAALLVYYGVVPGLAIVFLPLFVLLALVTASGICIWLSALAVEYRDVQYVIPFLLQLMLFVTPIAYPATIVPERWRVVLDLNPMAGVVEGFRWTLLGAERPGVGIAASAVVAVALLVGGVAYFRRVEDTFADVI